MAGAARVSVPVGVVVPVVINRPAGPILKMIQGAALVTVQTAVSQGEIPVPLHVSLLVRQVREFPLGYLAISDTLVNSLVLIILPLLKPIAGRRDRRRQKQQRGCGQNHVNSDCFHAVISFPSVRLIP